MLALRLHLISALFPVYLVFLVTLLVCLHFQGSWPYTPKRVLTILTLLFPAFFGVPKKCGHYVESRRKGIWSPLVALCLLLFGWREPKTLEKIVVSGDNSRSKVIRVNGDVAFWAKKGQNNTRKIGVKKKGTIYPPCWAIFFTVFGAQTGGVQKMRSKIDVGVHRRSENGSSGNHRKY